MKKVWILLTVVNVASTVVFAHNVKNASPHDMSYNQKTVLTRCEIADTALMEVPATGKFPNARF